MIQPPNLNRLPTWMHIAILVLFVWGATLQPVDGIQEAIWVNLILLVAAVLLQELLRPKPDVEAGRPASLGDFGFTTATEGRVVPILWGKNLIKGANLIWYGDFSQLPIYEKIKTGLWGSQRVRAGTQYFVGLVFALCRGEATLKRIRVGEVDVFDGTLTGGSATNVDLPALFGGNSYGNGGMQFTAEYFDGDETQNASSYLVQNSVGTTAYRGTAYVVVKGLQNDDLGAYVGNSTQLANWQFEVERFPAIFSGQSAGENKVGSDDCNPINVIYEILTNTEWGFGFPAADIDVGTGSSFVSAADTMITEVNGFSMVLDREMEAARLLQELQRHVDGVVFLDHRTGKWKIKLARDDYDINTVPQLNEGNIKEVKDFARSSWDDTINQVTVKFAKRVDDYNDSFAVAQDPSSALIQGGGSVTTINPIGSQVVYPGCKTAALAAILAWRDLRGQSYPLARATFVLTREFWDLTIGDVVAWTDTNLGFTKLPMRVSTIDYGTLADNAITVTCVQDVFRFAAASGGTPPGSGWQKPGGNLVAYPADEQLAFECPRALLVRDPDFQGDSTVSLAYCAARRQGTEIIFTPGWRHASGSPTGPFASDTGIGSFMRVGSLTSALSKGTAIPTSTITITPSPDSQVILEAAFDDTASTTDLGIDLVHLIYVGGEFMLVSDAAINGANVDLQSVYRGVLDSAQKEHTAGTDVYLIFVGGGLANKTFPNTDNVDIELRMNFFGASYTGSTNVISFQMDKRPIRPYPPAAVLYDGATAYGTPALENTGSGLDGVGFDTTWWRRAYDANDEVVALGGDNSFVDASHETRVRMFVDPDGANTEIVTSSWATGTGPVNVTRLLVLNEAEAGTEIRVQLETRHDVGSETNLTSRDNLVHDVTPTTTLTGQFYLGGKLRANVVSNSYTALATGTYTVNIGSTFNSQIQFRLNGGTWTNLTGYTPGTSTTGTIPGVTSSDTIELRHQTNPGSPNLTFLELKNPSSTSVAYGILSN